MLFMERVVDTALEDTQDYGLGLRRRTRLVGNEVVLDQVERELTFCL